MEIPTGCAMGEFNLGKGRLNGMILRWINLVDVQQGKDGGMCRPAKLVFS